MFFGMAKKYFKVGGKVSLLHHPFIFFYSSLFFSECKDTTRRLEDGGGSLRQHFGGAVDGVLAPVVLLAAKPTGAAVLEADKEPLGTALQAETAPRRQVVEVHHRPLDIVFVVAVQQLLYLPQQRPIQRHTRRIAGHQRPHLGREPHGMLGQQPRILPLPLVPVGRHIGVFHMRLKVRSLMQEHQQETVWVKVAVDRHLMKIMAFLRPTVVAVL